MGMNSSSPALMLAIASYCCPRRLSRLASDSLAWSTWAGMMSTDIAAAPVPGIVAFTFGDPMPGLDGRELLDYLKCWLNGRWYGPPLSLDGLAKSTRGERVLQNGLNFKRNMLNAQTRNPIFQKS